jgi:hypothetical protein
LSNYKLVYTAGAEFEIILNFFPFPSFLQPRMQHLGQTIAVLGQFNFQNHATRLLAVLDVAAQERSHS